MHRCATCGVPLAESGFLLLVPGVPGAFHTIDCALDALRRQERQRVTPDELRDELLDRVRTVRGRAGTV